MKRFILFLILTFSIETHAQWMQTRGPYGGEIFCLAGNGTTIFAGCYGGGIFRSVDNGVNWVAVNNGLPLPLDVVSIAISGNNIFAAGFNGKVYLSNNNGGNWTSASSSIVTQHIYGIGANGTNIFASTQDGIFLSTDTGVSWTKLLSFYAPQQFLFNGSDIFIASGGIVQLSSDTGKTWTSVSNGLANTSPNNIIMDGGNLFVGTTKGVYISTNYGLSWTPRSTGGLANRHVTSIVAKNGNLFAATDDGAGVFRSGDSGSTWTPVNSGLVHFVNTSMVHTLWVSGNDILAGTISGGVFKSTDDGNTWARSNSGLANSIVISIGEHAGIIYAGASNDGLWKSTDGGNTWEQTSLLMTHVTEIAFSGNNIFAGGDVTGMALSTDNGNTWTAINNGLTNPQIRTLLVNGTDIYAGTNGGGLFFSSDTGKSWAPLNNGLTSPNYVGALVMNGNIMYAGTAYGVFLSTNNGNFWTQTNLKSGTVSDLAIVGHTIFACIYNSGIYLSSDTGKSWTLTNTGLLNYRYANSLATSGNDVFASVEAHGVYHTTNGTNWESINDGLDDSLTYTIETGGSEIFAGNYRSGLWKRPLSQVVGSKEIKKENDFVIYPNPAGNRLTICTPSHNQPALVSVLTMMGQTALPATSFPAGNNITMDISMLPAGIYFLRIKAGDDRVIKKFIKE